MVVISVPNSVIRREFNGFDFGDVFFASGFWAVDDLISCEEGGFLKFFVDVCPDSEGSLGL